MKILKGGPELNFDILYQIEIFEESNLGQLKGSAITDPNILRELMDQLTQKHKASLLSNVQP